MGSGKSFCENELIGKKSQESGLNTLSDIMKALLS
jgi:hypothetical protein